jgi:hypothetical protein
MIRVFTAKLGNVFRSGAIYRVEAEERDKSLHYELPSRYWVHQDEDDGEMDDDIEE